MLQAHPQLIHLHKVGQDEADRVLQIALRTFAVACGQTVACLAGKIVPQKQAADRVLHAATHLHHVLHDLLHRRILNGHVDGADSAHEVQAGNDIPGILDQLVQVGEVVDGVILAKVDGEVPQGIKDGHIELVVLLGAEAAGPQLRNECGAGDILVSTTMQLYIRIQELPPVLEGVHQLAGDLKAPPHEHRLLAHHCERILKQASLIFYWRRRRHCVCGRISGVWRAKAGVVVNGQAPAGLVFGAHVNGSPR